MSIGRIQNIKIERTETHTTITETGRAWEEQSEFSIQIPNKDMPSFIAVLQDIQKDQYRDW